MKNTFITMGLCFALICVTQIWAQDSAIVSEQLDAASPKNSASDDNLDRSAEALRDKGISIDVSIDDPVGDKDALERIAKVVREVAGDEVADEVVLELEGLSDDEREKLRAKIVNGIQIGGNEVPGWVGAVAILGVIFIFGAPVWILLVVFIFGARKRKQKMHLIQMYLDSGKDVPNQVLATFGASGTSFRSGIMLSAVGLGIVTAFNVAGEESIGALGLIPLFIGLAKLLYWFIEERKYENN